MTYRVNPTTGEVENVGLANPVCHIQFKLDPDEAMEEGRAQWNALDQTIDVDTGTGPVLQVGQESYIKVKNNSGDLIENGSAVYIVSADSDRPTIELALAMDQSISEKTIGITTQRISNGAEGFVTTFGKIRGTDTSSYSLGDTLYVSPTVAGGLTNVRPTKGDYKIPTAIVTSVDAVNGELFVRYNYAIDPDEIKNASGFPDEDGAALFTISFTDLTRSFEIAPVGDYFYFWQLGVKYNKYAAESVIIPDEEGVYYFYYDLGVLTYAKNPSDGDIDTAIRKKTLVAVTYWDATNKENLLLGAEYHGHDMSGTTHAYLHFSKGVAYISGLTLEDMDVDGNGDDDTAAQFGIGMGVSADEDLINFMLPVDSTAGLPVFYLDGANAYQRRLSHTGFSLLTDIDLGTGTTGRPVWNSESAGTWGVTTVGNNDYVLAHVFTTNDKVQTAISFMGQNVYATVGQARTGALIEIETILSKFPAPELLAVATVIYQVSNTYDNGVKARVRSTDEGNDYIDWRTSEATSSGGSSASVHGNLAGLANDDHLQYLLRTDEDKEITIEDTQANILASTPDKDIIARATDTEAIFLWDLSKTQWYQYSSYFDEAGMDIGYTQESNKKGYGPNYVDDKTLYNVRVGGKSSDAQGSIRVNSGVFQIYINDAWQDVVTNFRFREDPTGGYELEHKPVGFNTWIEVRSGNSDTLDPSGRPVIQEYQRSIGVYQVPVVIRGGGF